MSRRRRGSPTSGTRGSAARSPTPISLQRRGQGVRRGGARGRAPRPRASANGGGARDRTWMRGTYNGTAQIVGAAAAARRGDRHGALALVAGPGDARRRHLRADHVLRHPGLSARCRHAHPQPAALGERHGGAGRLPRRADRRGRPRRRARRSRSAAARSTLRPRDLPLRAATRRRSTSDFSVDDRGGREGRPGRPLRLGQDDLRQADPAALRRERRTRS